jgi:ubiquitin C-terminal hydrolase
MDLINSKSNGLNNLGNTCFFNSILQLLFQCTVLNKLIISNNINSGLISYYFKFISTYSNSTNSFSPSDIIAYVDKILGRTNYQQEDAEQYLNYIIDSITDELKEWTKQNMISNVTIQNKNLTLDKLINSLFTIDIKKHIICPNCNHVSISKEYCNKLYLPIRSNSDPTKSNPIKSNLLTLIDEYTNETLDESNKYKCERCAEYVRAHLYREIISIPKYLIIVLKRYSNSNTKLNDQIQIEQKIIINNKKYYLRGIVYHMGSTSGGHYVYYGNKNNNWYLYNDSSVQVQSESNINSIIGHGYIYLYVNK